MTAEGPDIGNLDALGAAILARIQDKNGERERVLAMSRQVVQHAARAIRAAHRREWADADGILADGDHLLRAMNDAASGHADLMAAGYTLDAQKEHSEAHLVRALLRGYPLPDPVMLGVDDAAWLNGLGEAAAELRRACLDAIRRGEVAEAEHLLDALQEIYVFLSTVDFPDAITRGLKRTNDMVRGVAERTRGDLTVAVRQEDLKAAMERLERRLPGASV
jgi:translin